MNHKFRLTAEKISQRLRVISGKYAKQKQAIAPFWMERLEGVKSKPDLQKTSKDQIGQKLEWNSYWGGQGVHFALRSSFSVPKGWEHPALHLPLGIAGDIFTHPEALLYIDGEAIASADRYHHLIDIPSKYQDGQAYEILLYGWTGLAGWPPDPKDPTQLLIKECSVVDVDRDVQKFIALATSARELCDELPEHSFERQGILNAVDAAFLALDTRDPMEEAFYASVPSAITVLKEGFAKAGAPMDVAMHGIGHAHMDVAYLWPIDEIRHKNGRTYSNVLRLMEKYPDFTFSHSQPQLYEWTKEDYPEIFEGIKERIQEGRWEVLSGMWIEPDANMPGSESLVRQITMAQSYCNENFGENVATDVLWLPDTFGFPACLPQLMKQAGIEYFVTNKVNWNQYNQMPSSTTWWEGVDGSKVLAQFMTTPRPVQHLPFPTNYKSDLTAKEVLGTWENNTAKHAVDELMICYGYGDGGGGPTDDLIAKAEVWENMPAAPKMQLSTVKEYFTAIEGKTDTLPTWKGELYVEGHRGVLTSQAWIKRANRKMESLLHDVELAMSYAVLEGHRPRDISHIWKRFLTLQFHDILTGTSVPEVFEDARADFKWMRAELETILAETLPLISSNTADVTILDGAQIAGVRYVELPKETTPLQENGISLPAQICGAHMLVELPQGEALSLRSLNHASAWAYVHEGVQIAETEDGIFIENTALKVQINSSGLIEQIYDKRAKRNVLAQGECGNQLLAFEDRPISWDAWDIDAFIEDRSERVSDLISMRIFEKGPLRGSIELKWRYRSSEITQIISLHRASARIDFKTEVDWHESHILLKAAFPVDIHAPRATYEIQWGSIERPTHQNTPWDAAKFEVPAQKWADLSEGDYGVALLNDCKYGYDIKDNIMRLSLIKSSTSPSPNADQGHHEFTYALLPHLESDLGVVQKQAIDLNSLPKVLLEKGKAKSAPLPIAQIRDPQVILQTIKPAENGKDIVIRAYESKNTRGPVQMKLSPDIREVRLCTLSEVSGEKFQLKDAKAALYFKPFEIKSFKLSYK